MHFSNESAARSRCLEPLKISTRRENRLVAARVTQKSNEAAKQWKVVLLPPSSLRMKHANQLAKVFTARNAIRCGQSATAEPTAAGEGVTSSV